MSTRDTASTFAKGLALLSCFEEGQGDLTMADLARLTGFDRATARRLCLTLEQSGYLYRRGKSLRLAPKVLVVAGGYLRAEQIGKSVQPVLNQFAEELDGEIALAVRDGNRAVYVARSAVASARLSLGLSVGSTLPLLPTAVGRMLLAGCERPERDKMIAECPLDPFTAQTTLDRAAIGALIQIAETQGYAYVAHEFEMGAAGIAVPVRGISQTQAVLATTASAHDLATSDQQAHTLNILRKAAISLAR